jgi:TrmH family RNA methyltransferase
MKEVITSVQNTLVKKVKRLTEKAAARKEEKRFVVEGVRECSLLQRGGFEVECFIVCREIYRPSPNYPIEFSENTRWVSPQVYHAMAYREKSEGVIAVAFLKTTQLSELRLSKYPLILVAAEVEKPGNLGAMLRTADACGVDAVLVCDEKADVFNPNVLRSSLGTFFTNQVVVCSWQAARAFLHEKQVNCVAAHVGASKSCYEFDFTRGTAFVLGSEAHGLSNAIADSCHAHVKIPMMGKIDSLNVSVSAAVLLYEAVRQRLAGCGSK